MAITARQLPASAAAHLQVEVRSWRDVGHVEADWRDLVERRSDASFFMTPEWVGAWLDTFAATLDPKLVLFRDRDASLAGLCLIVERTERKGPFRIRRVYLHTAGEDDADSPCVEFSTLLGKPGLERAMAAALRLYLFDRSAFAPWDELYVPGLVAGPALDALTEAFADLDMVDQCKPSYYVALDPLRSSGRDYLDALSRKERSHLRQNIRKYSQVGELRLVAAATTDEALHFLDELAALHQSRWVARGERGAFASPAFHAFHRRLIARCYPRGDVELLRLHAGGDVVGYHYYLVFRGRSYFYQCGYDYALCEKNSPGVTLHALALQDKLQTGLSEYDFMAGDVEYKKRLSTSSRDLHWLSWRVPNLKMRAVEAARGARHLMRSPRIQIVRERARALISPFTTARGNVWQSER